MTGEKPKIVVGFASLQILLDCTHECAIHSREPTLGIVSSKKRDADLSDEFAKMNVRQTFHNRFDDDDDPSTLNDFHLAEIDLIECLLRTNILQRIQ